MQTRIGGGFLILGMCVLAVALTVACGRGEEHRGANDNASNTAVVTNTSNTAPGAGNTAASANDAAIRSSVEANLKQAGITGVNVRVESGVVYLTGSVPSANFTKAVQAANEAYPKPTRVDNSGLTKG